MTGFTDSSNFPTTPGAYDTGYNGGRDAFVTKLDMSSNSLVFSTFLGSSGEDEGRNVALATDGRIYLTTSTGSSSFPITPDAQDDTYNGGQWDVALSVLTPLGDGLEYSTYLGGSAADRPQSLVLGGDGSALIGVATSSGDFPTTAGAYDTTYNAELLT